MNHAPQPQEEKLGYYFQSGACLEAIETYNVVFKNKTKVWMVLQDLTLTYYKNNKRSSCIGSIDMSTVQSVAQKKTMGGGRQFEINTATKSYQFDAETSELCEAWVKVLLQSLSLKSDIPGSEFNTESNEDIRPSSGSINRSSRASGKERSSSSTFQNELDSLPASPTVFGVKLRSTRQSRKSDDLLTERNVSSSGSISPTSSGAPRPHTERTVSQSSPITPISPGPSVENIKSKFSFKGFKRTKSNSSANDDVDSFKKDVSIDKNYNQVSTKATWYTGQDENSNEFDNIEMNSNNSEISGSTISIDPEMSDKVNAKVHYKEEEIVTLQEPNACFDKTDYSESINEQNVFTDDVTLTCFTKTLENEKIIENPILQNTESVDFKHTESEDTNINNKTEEDISEVVLRKSRKENHKIDNDSLDNSNSGVFQVQMRKSGRVISIRDDNINGDYSNNGEDAHLDTKESVTHLKEASNGEIASFNKEQSNSSLITNSRTVDLANDIEFQTEEIPRSKEEVVEINDQTNQQDTIKSPFQNGDYDDTVFKDEISSNLPADKQQLNLVAYHKLITFLQDLDTSYDIEYHTSRNDNPIVALEELLSNNS